jgi:hypothetical protein
MKSVIAAWLFFLVGCFYLLSPIRETLNAIYQETEFSRKLVESLHDEVAYQRLG